MTDEIRIHNGAVTVITEEGRKVQRTEAQLLDMLRRETTVPLKGKALPDGVKFIERRGGFCLVVHQLPPHVRQFRWIANDSPVRFGPGTTYRKVRLSIPYAITFALYVQSGRGDDFVLSGSNELYFRNEPLVSRDDRIFFPALLNISRIQAAKRERAWICTQHLHYAAGADWTCQLQALLDHTWNGGFNLSSEHHEGSSWYGTSQGIHPDLHPVERWEKASAANDAFALGVPWIMAPLTAGQLMDCLFEENEHALAGSIAPVPKAKKPLSLVGRFLNFVLND